MDTPGLACWTLGFVCVSAMITASQGAPPASYDCHQPLGVANSGLIPVFWLHSSDGFAYRGRLHRKSAWLSSKPLYLDVDSKDPKIYSWIQVDLRRPTLVTGLQTQGDPRDSNWVTWYSIYYSNNCEIFNPVLDSEGYVSRFHGNHDSNTTVTSLFPDPVVSRCIRLVPLRRTGNSTALRLEILGCDVRMCREAVITHMETVRNYDNFRNLTALTVSLLADEHTESENETSLWSHEFPHHMVQPTSLQRGYAEFKFRSEQIMFGLVTYNERDTWRTSEVPTQAFMVTYSRNCQDWEAVRNQKRVGDPKTFSERPSRYRTTWHIFPYPVRAQCVRVIPMTSRYAARVAPIKAHFIGCGTGSGVSGSCGLQKRAGRTKRVIGGSVSDAGQWPWLVSIQIPDNLTQQYYHVCGGTLIHPQWILTAVHCVHVMYALIQHNATDDVSDFLRPKFISNIRVLLGRHSLTLTEDTGVIGHVEKVIGHAEFNRTFYINDVALVKLTQPVRLTDHVSLVCTPSDVSGFMSDSDCRVVGWGRTTDGFPARPHSVATKMFRFADCQEIFSHLNLTTDMLCAGSLDGSADACFGDSGGPLVCERDRHWYQVGIVSWNIGCAADGFPGVYANVAEHLDWIHTTMAELDTPEEDPPLAREDPPLAREDPPLAREDPQQEDSHEETPHMDDEGEKLPRQQEGSHKEDSVDRIP